MLGCSMMMAQSGLCGISVNSKFAIPRICPLKTRMTRVVPSHFIDHASATCSLLPFMKMYKGNKIPASQISTYSSQGEHGNLRTFLPVTSKRRWKLLSPRAEKDDTKDDHHEDRYPPMERGPRWWMRLLATWPYMISAHVCWVFAETTYSMHPFLEDLEPLTICFLGNGLSMLPSWFFTAYFFVAYMSVVRSNKIPHFLRFHVLNGMLLEITFSILGQLNDWFPKAFYWGLFGQHFWWFCSVAFLWTCIYCILYALGGMYADVPFLSDAAYMQIPY